MASIEATLTSDLLDMSTKLKPYSKANEPVFSFEYKKCEWVKVGAVQDKSSASAKCPERTT